MSAPKSIRPRGAMRCSPTSPTKPRNCPGRKLTSIFFGGGTPSLMPPATVAAVLDAAERAWGFSRRDRDHAGGQPFVGRSRALRRPSRRRRQPRIARAAGARRRRAPLPRPRPRRERRPRRARHRPTPFRPGQLRPDLRPPRTSRSPLGKPNSRARSASAPNISRSINSPSSPARASPPKPPPDG